MEALTGFMIAGFIIFSGKLISTGELGINNFFSFLAAMMLAYQPIRSLATINMAAYQGAAAFKRISNIIDREIKIKEVKETSALFKNSDIKFNNVGFKYESTEENKEVVSILREILWPHCRSQGQESTIINLLLDFMNCKKVQLK